ncbi:MAG: dual specificity protein phosphatase family protein [bacterium]|jgi:atypical dual specificity phosphatase|nr:dual specificity protein phosphatase family protein [bacterium]
MAHFFTWIVPGQLAGMGRPGCGLELAGQMMPYEQRFLSWVMHSQTLVSDRQKLARRISLPGSNPEFIERRMSELYHKFRDVWPILASYSEGFGSDGQPVDRFKLSRVLLEQDLAFLVQQGINTIVSLTETPLDSDLVNQIGFDCLHMPVPDRHALEPRQIDELMAYLDEKLGAGRSIVVHCLGGYGRTGTALACYMVYCGAEAGQALLEIRRLRPDSVETEEQELAIYAYEERIR